MKKLYFDENGWVCERYPSDIKIINYDRYIEVTDEVYEQTLCAEKYKQWRVVNDNLILDTYNAPTETETKIKEYEQLKQKLADMDYKSSKYLDGEYSVDEWKEITEERKQIRIRIRELEPYIQTD